MHLSSQATARPSSYPTPHRIPSLDGIRAVAIGMVICCHLSQASGKPLFTWIANGQDGVGLFFVLSGYLVTTLLLKEHARAGSISLPRFYARRARRIMPPMLVYLAVVALICPLMHQHLSLRTVVGAVCFLPAMAGPSTWLTEHFWSLSVEEQYYLLWPVLLTLGLRFGRKAAALLCGLLICVAPLLRVCGHEWAFLHHRMSYLLPTRMDALLAGCLVALLVGSRRFEAGYARVARFGWLLPVLLFGAFPLATRHYGNAWLFSAGYTLAALAGAGLVLWLSRTPECLLGRVANHPWVARVGVLSYSIYLVQTAWLHGAQDWTHIAAAGAGITLCALTSYYLVELPTARWGKRSTLPTHKSFPQTIVLATQHVALHTDPVSK